MHGEISPLPGESAEMTLLPRRAAAYVPSAAVAVLRVLGVLPSSPKASPDKLRFRPLPSIPHSEIRIPHSDQPQAPSRKFTRRRRATTHRHKGQRTRDEGQPFAVLRPSSLPPLCALGVLRGETRCRLFRIPKSAIRIRYTSRLRTSRACFSMNSRRGWTLEPIRTLNMWSASDACSTRTCFRTRRAGSIVVSHN